MAAARLADAWNAARRSFNGSRTQASRTGETVRNDRTYAEPAMTQAGARPGHEPTMEDILASIRRIIAEDYSAQMAAPPQSVAQGQQSVAMLPQPVPVRHAMPMPQPEPLDLSGRGERFMAPMPEVVQVQTPTSYPQTQMPRAYTPPLQAAAPEPQTMAPVAMTASASAASAAVPASGFAARAVSEFSERLGRSFAAAERYQREAQAAVAPKDAAPAPVQPHILAREPISQSAVQAVAAAVQSHLAEAQALQAGQAAASSAPPPAAAAQPAQSPRSQEPARSPFPLRPRMAAEQSTPTAQDDQAAPRPPVAMKPATDVQPIAQTAQTTPAASPAPKPQVDPVLQNDPPPAWLLSPKTGSSISGSFKSLQEKQAVAPVTLTETQSAALQDLVAAALRPMLKDWLDAHLPGMVERMITAEIQRVTRGE